MSRPLSDKIIEDILHEDSDSESVIGSRPEEEYCNDSEVISDCEDPVTLDVLNDSQEVDSNTEETNVKFQQYSNHINIEK